MPDFEFGTRDDANAFREEYEEHLCPHDDRRRKTVTLVSDAPDRVVEQATVQAASSRDEQGSRGGQPPLDDHERDRIDFESTNVLHARSVNGIAREAGVDDWLAYYDPTLTVDEHREVMEEAARDETGKRMDAEDTAEEHLADVEKALGEECDHAAGHCANGDEGACEFLRNQCDLEEEEVQSILSDDEGDPAKGELPGEAYRALEGLWTSYRAGLGQAKEAAAGINEVRAQFGQEPMTFDELGDREIIQEMVA
jgi:hypothetical protein